MDTYIALITLSMYRQRGASVFDSGLDDDGRSDTERMRRADRIRCNYFKAVAAGLAASWRETAQ